MMPGCSSLTTWSPQSGHFFADYAGHSAYEGRFETMSWWIALVQLQLEEACTSQPWRLAGQAAGPHLPWLSSLPLSLYVWLSSIESNEGLSACEVQTHSKVGNGFNGSSDLTEEQHVCQWKALSVRWQTPAYPRPSVFHPSPFPNVYLYTYFFCSGPSKNGTRLRKLLREIMDALAKIVVT